MGHHNQHRYVGRCRCVGERVADRHWQHGQQNCPLWGSVGAYRQIGMWWKARSLVYIGVQGEQACPSKPLLSFWGTLLVLWGSISVCREVTWSSYGVSWDVKHLVAPERFSSNIEILSLCCHYKTRSAGLCMVS